MEPLAFHSANETVREMNDFTRIYDGVHSAMVRVASEGQKRALLTPEFGEALLNLSEKVLTSKTVLQDMAAALKGTKEKALKDDKLKVRECYNNILTEQQGKRNNNEVENDEFRSRLKTILQESGFQTANGNVLDEVGNANDSLVLDELNTRTSQKCPITLKPIVNPYRNQHCHHVFERDAVLDYISKVLRNGGKARCPNIGCTNKKKFGEFDFEVDHTLQRAGTQQF